MDDIKRLRKYNKRVFVNPIRPDRLKAHIYTYPIHYENRLLIGDGEYGYRKIDATLAFDESKKGWTFEYNNFHPLIPEYADEVLSFRDVYHDKDQTIRLRPLAQHVKGRLVEKLEGVSNGFNAVVYDNAFGQDVDLIIHPTVTGIRKLVRVRGYRKDQDLTFDFELETPEEKPSIVARSKKAAKRGDFVEAKQKTVDLSDGKRIIVGNVGYNKRRENQTFIQQVRVWDSAENRKTEKVKAQLITKGKKTILRKIIPASFLEKAEGFVYTDAVLTIQETKDTYYGSSSDTGGQPNSDTLRTGSSTAGGFFFSFLEWDLTDSPLVEKTIACKIFLKVKAVDTNDPTNEFQVVTSSWNEEDPTFASAPNVTTAYDVAMPNPITLGVDAWSETEVNYIYEVWKTGVVTNNGVRVGFASVDLSITDYYSSDDATEGNRPYMEVDYIASPETNTKQLFPGGINVASPSTSATNFAHIFGQGSGESWSATSNFRKVIFSEDGAIKRVRFEISTPPGVAKQYSFRLRRNGVDVWQTIINGSSATSGTLSIDREIIAGDDITIACVPTNTPNSCTVKWGIEFWSTGDNYTIPAGTGSGAAVNGSVNYNNAMVGGGWFSSEANRTQVMPHDGTIKKFMVKMFSAPGAAASGKQWTWKIRKNSSDVTGSDVVIFETDTEGVAEDIDIAISAGDLIDVSIVGANTPTASAAAWAISILPNTPGESAMISSTGNALNATQLQYQRVTAGGAFAESTTEANVVRLIASEDSDGTTVAIGAILRDLYFRLSSAPGAGDSYTITLRKNAGDTALTATISDTDTTGSDITNSASITDGDELAVSIQPSGTPAARIAQWSMVQYIPPSPYDITKSLQYTILTSDSVTKSLRYDVLTSDAVTKSLVYEIVAPVSITKNLEYTVLTTPSAVQKSLEYDVLLSDSVTKSLEYNIVSGVVVNKGLIYEVITDTAVTKALVYEIVSYETITKGLIYEVTTPVAVTKSLVYEIVDQNAVTKSLVYEVIVSEQVTKSLTYTILSVTGITKSLVYEVLVSESITKSLVYEVVSPVSITKSLVYEVITEQVVQKSLEYQIETSAVIQKSLVYVVLIEGQSLTKSLVYKVLTENALTNSAVTKSLEYSILTTDAISKGLIYEIVSPVSLTKTLRYNVLSTPKVTRSLVYEVIVENAITKSLEYNIVSLQAVTKSLKYTVITDSARTLSLIYRIVEFDYYPLDNNQYTSRNDDLSL